MGFFLTSDFWATDFGGKILTSGFGHKIFQNNFSVDFVFVKTLGGLGFWISVIFLWMMFWGKTWPFVILDPSTATAIWHKLNLCKF